jgi:hypothetical protein
MFLHERFALFVGLGPIKLEEAVVARRFSLGTSATTRNGGQSHCFLIRQRGGGMVMMTTYGFRPWGLRGFCLGSVGSYGTFAGCGVGAGDQRAVT